MTLFNAFILYLYLFSLREPRVEGLLSPVQNLHGRRVDACLESYASSMGGDQISPRRPSGAARGGQWFYIILELPVVFKICSENSTVLVLCDPAEKSYSDQKNHTHFEVALQGRH